MREALRLLAVAVQLLTRLPVRAPHRGTDDLRRAAGAFPLVGLVVAATSVAVRAAAAPLWGPLVATVLAVAAAVALTGALHEDGLADAADGLWGGDDPERRVAIMRDSRVGTYGIIALVAYLGLRVALLAPLELAAFARALVCAHALAQLGMLAVAWVLPPAAGGSGAAFGRPPPVALAVASGIAAAAVLLVAGLAGVAVLAVAALTALACAGLARRRLGGFTGDVLGAANSATHLAALAAFTALAT